MAINAERHRATDLLVDLVQEGLATATPETVPRRC
jgi:hypothetical protein